MATSKETKPEPGTNNISTEDEKRTDQTQEWTGKCQKCTDVRKVWKSKTHFFIHHTKLTTLCGQSKSAKEKVRKKKEKQRTLDEIAKFAAALRNTEGGEILVHIEGQLPDQRNLEYFDESIGKRLEELIDDGQLYHDVYNRAWISDIDPKYKLYPDFVVISVTKTRGVATVLFNTKIRNDFENKSPLPLQVLTLLSKSPVQQLCGEDSSELKTPKLSSESPVVSYSLSDQNSSPVNNHLCVLHESRHAEFKRFQPDEKDYAEWRNQEDRVVDYIWSDLKLKDNIASMSKVPDGGSFYVGIGETHKSRHGSMTFKETDVLGLDLHVPEEKIQTCLLQKINANISVLQHNEFEETNPDFVEIKFHPFEQQEKIVLEVIVRQVDGIVFYDKDGPRTYVVHDQQTKRMDKEEWLKRMVNHHVSVSLKKETSGSVDC